MPKNIQQKPPSRKRAGSSLNGAAGGTDFERELCRRLASVQTIDAVYLDTDDQGTIHVYSVTPEYGPDVYAKLLIQERLVEKAFPQLAFEFHVRAHQGRKPASAVPFGLKPLFVR
jgi:hypothetical protein